jgi:hypothetical protein
MDVPLEPTLPSFCKESGIKLIVVNELIVRSNLPAATRETWRQLR